MHHLERCAAGCVLACVAVVAMAALPPELARRLASLPAPLQQLVQQRQARLDAMQPAERQALQARRRAWDALPLAQRAELREHWQAWQSLPPTQRRQVRDAATAFATLPPERQRELRQDFAELLPDERRGWLLGPRVGAQWARLQPLLMQVPAGERDALLSTLQAMTTGELEDLAVLAQRTPPQERAALREDLLRTSADNRRAWLQLRLER